MVKRWVLLGLSVALVVLMYVGAPRTRAATSTITGTIKDAQGNPINGTVTFQLPVPAVDTATNTAVAPAVESYRVVNGVIQAGPPLYDVAGLQPQNLYYAAKVYDTAGNVVLFGNYVVTGGSFNFGAAVPTTVTTSNISYVTPVVTSASNSFTATQSFNTIASNSSPLALSGFMRMGNLDQICWRNVSNSADICIGNPAATPGAGFAFSTPGTSVSTNFGTNIGTTLMGSVGSTGVVELMAYPIQSVAGVGCSALNNTVTPTIFFTDPGGTADSMPEANLLIVGNGAVDSNIHGGIVLKVAAQSGSSINFTTTSVLNSAGCSTVPQYKIYTKVIQ